MTTTAKASIHQRVSPAQQLALDGLIQARAEGTPAAIRAAEQQVITEHLGFSTALARRYSNRGIEFDDLQQLARLGLVRAVKRWEPVVGADFLPFAYPTILGEIKRFFRDHSTIIRPPRGLQELHQEIQLAAVDLEQHLGRPATEAELAHAVGTSVERVREERAAARASRAVSLDLPVVYTMADQLPHEHAESDFDEVEDTIMVRRAMTTLTVREQKILYLRYFQDNSQAQIARVIGVSQMQISRILRDITATLRASLQAPHPRTTSGTEQSSLHPAADRVRLAS